MDQDQDLLDQLDAQERPSLIVITALIVGVALIASIVGYLTLRLELHSGKEAALDASGLIAIAASAGMILAYRKFGQVSR